MCLLAAGGFTLGAAPLYRADVAAEPTWVVHIDCDGLRRTDVGKYLLTEMTKPGVEPRFAAFQTYFSFDPRKQMHGITAYSTGNQEHDGVMVVYAEFEPERLVALAQAAKGSASTNHGAHVIYSWQDNRTASSTGIKGRIYAAIHGQRAIFGERASRVAAALDVMDRKTSNLKVSRVFPELGAPDDTSVIEAMGRKVYLPDASPTAALFRLSKTVHLQVHETNQQVLATVKLDAVSEDLARQMVTTVQGAAAMAKLQSEKPEARMFAEALNIKRDGTLVEANITMPATQLTKMIGSMLADDDAPAKK